MPATLLLSFLSGSSDKILLSAASIESLREDMSIESMPFITGGGCAGMAGGGPCDERADKEWEAGIIAGGCKALGEPWCMEDKDVVE